MIVRNEVEGIVILSQLQSRANRAEVIAEMRGPSGLNSGEGYFFHGAKDSNQQEVNVIPIRGSIHAWRDSPLGSDNWRVIDNSAVGCYIGPMFVHPPYILVETQDALRNLAKILDGVTECALDTEADSMHHYHVRLCLIQITVAGQNFIVDPLTDLDLKPLWAARGMKNLIIHGADYDLRMLHNTFGFVPETVFDTMIAAKFLGIERIGLAHLVEGQFGVHLSKANQKADWTIRPLPEDMKQYAILDTFFLAEIKENLTKQLQECGKLAWVEETCNHIIHQAETSPFMEDDEEDWRIRGSIRLHPNELIFLKALFYWREQEAERLDRPPFKVLSPDSMLDLAMECAYVTPDIRPEVLPRLPRNFTGDRLQSFLNALLDAAKVPESQWPDREKKQRTRTPSPDSNRLEEFRSIRDDVASKCNLEPTLLANRQALVALAMPGSTEELRRNARCLDWQWNLLAPALGLL